MIAYLLATTSSTASPAAGRSCIKDRAATTVAGSAISAAVSGSTLAIRRTRRSTYRQFRSVIGRSSPNLGASYYGPILDRKRPLRRGQTEPGELIRPRRPCQRCGSSLPVWVKGKAVRKSVKYCEGCRT